LDDELLALLQEVVDAHPILARAGLCLGCVFPAFLELRVRRMGNGVLDVEKRVAVEADRDEGRLHARQDAVDAALVDVADDALAPAALVEDLDRTPIRRERDAGLRRRRVDEELSSHALANRRYSTPRIRPIAANVVATEEPP